MREGVGDVKAEEDGEVRDDAEAGHTLIHDCCELRYAGGSAGSMTEWTREMRLNALGQLDAFALRLVAKPK
jgi:hypothetical protein